MNEVKAAIHANTVPTVLDNFWKGKIRYGLSGSVIMFLDKTYGRKKLLELLPFNKKTDILSHLTITEEELISRWKVYVQGE